MGDSLSKGSEQSTSINEDVAANAAENWDRAEQVASLGYQPNRGVTIAAFTPQQEAAMRGTNDAAQAFGMGMSGDPLAHMPTPETSASGIRGYSTGADYDQMLARLPPEFRAAIEGIFQKPAAPSRTANFGFSPFAAAEGRMGEGNSQYGGGTHSVGDVARGIGDRARSMFG